MTNLSEEEKREYIETHIPYMRKALSGHYILCKKGSYKEEDEILTAAFLGSLIAGRAILEFLGIGLSEPAMKLKPAGKKRKDSVVIEDIDGQPVDLEDLQSRLEEHDLIAECIKMANKAAAHITLAEERPWRCFHPMAELIKQLLDTQMETVPKH